MRDGRKGRTGIYSTSRWKAVRLMAMHRDSWQCRQCGRVTGLQVHHIEPIAAGGAGFDLDNLETICRDCHYGRHRRVDDPESVAWRLYLEECHGAA